MAPVSQAPRRYFIEFNVAMLLYAGAVVGRQFALHAVSAPALKTLILLSPIPPVLLAVLAVVRFYRRIDELQKRRLLESLAVSAGVTGVFAICWGFLTDVGAPPLSIGYAWGVMGLSWLITAAAFGWRDSVSEGRLGKVFRNLAVTIALVAVVTAAYAFAAIEFGLPHSARLLVLLATVVFLSRVGFSLFSKSSPSC